MDARCINCDAELQGDYCHRCGQRRGPRTLTTRELAGNAVREALSADGRLIRTLVPFFTRPGRLTEAYLAGQRVRFTPPLKLFLVALLLSVVAFRWATPEPDQFGLRITSDGIWFGEPEVAPARALEPVAPTPASRDRTSLIYRLFGHGVDVLARLPIDDATGLFFNQVFDAVPTVMTLVVPLFALFTRLFFHRRTYAEQLVLALHLHAAALLLFAAAALVGRPEAFLAAVGLFELYVAVAFRHVFAVGWPRAIASTLAIAVVHLALLAAGFVGATMIALGNL